MSVHGFVKIVEFGLLKLQANGKNKKQEHEAQKVSISLLQRGYVTEIATIFTQKYSKMEVAVGNLTHAQCYL